MSNLELRIGDDGTWECAHCQADGSPAPSTMLSVAHAIDENRHRSSRSVCLVCPDCGTYWRIWKDLKTAKPYFEPPKKTAHRWLRSPRREIDHVVAAVKREVPDVLISQLMQPWPRDDDNVWWFETRGSENNVQVDGGPSMGNGPFSIDATPQPSVVLHEPDAVARRIVEYLAMQRRN